MSQLPNEYIEGKVKSYREKMGAIGMRSDWQVGDEWLRTALTETWNKSREEAYAELRQKIKLAPKTELEATMNEDTYEEGYEQCLDDILSLLTPNQERG